MILIIFILVTFAKNLLEYSDDYARSVAKNSLWYLDTDATSDADTNTGFRSKTLINSRPRNLVDVTIPLKQGTHFFEELEGRMLTPNATKL